MRTNKSIAIFLAMLIFAGCLLSGCSKSDTADTYISLAQTFIDKAEYDSAIAILEEGFEKTGSKEIETILSALKALPTTTEPPTTEPATQATTVPATQPPATKPVNTAPLAQSGIQRRINLFLSNFAEQGFTRYPTSDSDLLDFGHIYCKINRSNVVHYENYYEYIKKSDMDTALKDLFGKTVNPDSSYVEYEWITYRNNAYYSPAGEGECYDYLAIASSMTKNSNGTYNVEFDIYYAESGLKSSYYDLTGEQAAKSSKLTWEGSGSAVVRDSTRSNGKKSYHLIHYQLN